MVPPLLLLPLGQFRLTHFTSTRLPQEPAALLAQLPPHEAEVVQQHREITRFRETNLPRRWRFLCLLRPVSARVAARLLAAMAATATTPARAQTAPTARQMRRLARWVEAAAVELV